MNFLSHYYYDHKPGEEYFNLGLIFPDLLRNFVPGARIEPGGAKHEAESSIALQQGCISHVNSDIKFHDSEVFKGLTNNVTQLIRNSRDPIRRDFFVAHIFVELLLDRSLLLVNPDLASRLYSDYERVDSQAIKQFLSSYDFDKFEQFKYGFERFLGTRYLEHYVDPQIILYSTERICTRMKLPAFSKGQKNVLLHIMDALDVNIADATKELEELLQ